MFFPVFPYPTRFCFIPSEYLYSSRVYLLESPILLFRASRGGCSSIAVRSVVVPTVRIVRIVVKAVFCVGIAAVIVVVSAISKARFVLFKTRGSGWTGGWTGRWSGHLRQRSRLCPGGGSCSCSGLELQLELRLNCLYSWLELLFS
jgi:hypothetical protein